MPPPAGKIFCRITIDIVIIALSHHSPRYWKQPQHRQGGGKLIGPEAAVEAESKLIEVALQMLFAQAMVGS